MERWDRRDRKRKARYKMPVHGKRLAEVYKNAVLKRRKKDANKCSSTIHTYDD